MSWTLNGAPLADLGVRLVSGAIRCLSTSTVQLEVLADFDDAAPFTWDAPLVLAGPGGVFFRGRARQMPAFGSGGREGQSIVIEDAWQDLEDTIYQEEWGVGVGAVEFPMAVLGLNKNGNPISTGQQIRDAISFAAGAGVDIQLGTVDDGVTLWPSEVENMSCAEVIRQQLRWHPDWVAWLDYQTSPPTFHCRAPENVTLRSASVAGDGWVKEFTVTERKDRVPRAVRIVYRTAANIDGAVYRDAVIDKYPADGPNKGPRVMSAIIDLAGVQAQFQKSRVQTRDLPTDSVTCRTWLKKKYPQIAGIPDEHWEITGFAKALVPEVDDHADPINPDATRLDVDTVEDVPRELVRGQIEDWMRRKVGKVKITANIKAQGPISDEHRKIIDKLAATFDPPGVTVVATNATTKIYKGITQWTLAENAPAGIAKAVYESLEAAQFEGSVTFKGLEIPSVRWHGCALNITGGRPEWATMKAPITQVSFDLDAGEVTVSFGPPEFLAPQDFLELQRMLRTRVSSSWSKAERSSNQLGAENAPGSRGDTVGGYDFPETTILGGGAGSGALGGATIVPTAFRAEIEGEGEEATKKWFVKLSAAQLWEISLGTEGKGHPIKIPDLGSETGRTLNGEAEIELSEGENEVWLKWTLKKTSEVEEDTPEIVLEEPEDGTPFVPDWDDSGADGACKQHLGTITVGSGDPVWKPVAPHAIVWALIPGISYAGGHHSLINTYDGASKMLRLRGLEQLAAAAVTDARDVIKAAGADIQIRQIAARKSEGTEDVEEGMPGGDPQIKVQVSPDGNAIIIRGNGYNKDVLLPGGWKVEIRDGLIKSLTLQ